jgi:uncharacterized Zn finger protein
MRSRNVKSLNTILRKMTFDDLREWAGGTILNWGRGYVERVGQLSRTKNNTLVAWVAGGDRYATSVRIDDEDDFEYFCTCAWRITSLYHEACSFPIL